jgi:8-oxo-dGTP diphosphatase
MKVELCVGAVVVADGRLLLVRRGRPPGLGQWSVPGGRVEAGERLADAVVRETVEETGIEVACGDLLGWVERIDEQHHFVILDFACEVVGGSDPVAGDDASEARWVPLGEVPGLPLVAGLLAFLEPHVSFA